MESNVLRLASSSTASQIHRCRTHPPSSSSAFEAQLLFKPRQWSPCSTGIFLNVAPWREGGRTTFRVYAAKPGFGARTKKQSKKPARTPPKKEQENPIAKAQQILARKEVTQTKDPEKPDDAPSLLENEETKSPDLSDEELFERRLAEIKQAAAEQKALAEKREYGPIDYDAALPSSSTPNGLGGNLGVKIGVVLAVVVFGLLFALGDFLPSGRPPAEKSSQAETKQLSKEESSKLQAQIQEFENVLQSSAEDRNALEGAAVSYAELGEYDKAIQYLSKIIQKSPGDVEVLRVLAEVQNGKGDLDASVSSYRAAIRASGKEESFTLLQGLVDTLLASKKPSEAVGELLAARSRLNYNLEQIKSNAKQTLSPPTSPGEPRDASKDAAEYNPVTLELLLGKAYAAWDGHSGDAASVYDGLIKSYPEDYRGYLAKGVLLKTQNKAGDAERMFIQARYLAPQSAKSIVDIYSGRRPS